MCVVCVSGDSFFLVWVILWKLRETLFPPESADSFYPESMAQTQRKALAWLHDLSYRLCIGGTASPAIVTLLRVWLWFLQLQPLKDFPLGLRRSGGGGGLRQPSRCRPHK